MHKAFLEGENVYLRAVEKDDLTSNMATWANDPQITHFMYLGLVPNGGVLYCSFDRLEVEYERMLASKNDVIFAIVHKKDSYLIGTCGLYGINWVARCAEFRIVIGESKYLGKGYGTEVARLVQKYAFEKLNLHKVSLGVNASDERANKSYQKAGFKFEGTHRDYHFRNGRYYDANYYSILESEYDKKANNEAA